VTTLRIETSSAVPIWSQIEEGVRHRVAVGELSPGSAVASVRDLARSLRVNPATVAKAYQRLADQGVLEVRRGSGTFVSAKPPTLSLPERRVRLAAGARRYAALAASLGLDESAAGEALAEAWAALGHPVEENP
jgi:GntR family transcriptional regulator